MRDAHHIEGFKKQALETGRNRLLVTGIVLAMAFSVISARLVDLTIFQGGGEPKLANIDHSPVPPFERADIVDRNGVLIARNTNGFNAGVRSPLVRDHKKFLLDIKFIFPS